MNFGGKILPQTGHDFLLERRKSVHNGFHRHDVFTHLPEYSIQSMNERARNESNTLTLFLYAFLLDRVWFVPFSVQSNTTPFFKFRFFVLFFVGSLIFFCIIEYYEEKKIN